MLIDCGKEVPEKGFILFTKEILFLILEVGGYLNSPEMVETIVLPKKPLQTLLALSF